jgi:hypothetical protein
MTDFLQREIQDSNHLYEFDWEDPLDQPERIMWHSEFFHEEIVEIVILGVDCNLAVNMRFIGPHTLWWLMPSWGAIVVKVDESFCLERFSANGQFCIIL